MKKIFVYGGCVSRDIFNDEYNSDLILSNYVARYSLAKLESAPIKLSIDKEKVTSSFQRRLLEVESNNLLLTVIDTSNFDFFLMDLMFLRYRLVCYKNSILTYSAELKKTGLIKSSHKVITSSDDVFWSNFQKGVDLLLEKLSSMGKLNSLIINKLYLSTITDQDVKFDNTDYIYRQNDILNKGYGILSRSLKKEQFINYDNKLFIARHDHRWGLNPMHYIDDFYFDSNKQIRSLPCKGNPHKIIYQL